MDWVKVRINFLSQTPISLSAWKWEGKKENDSCYMLHWKTARATYIGMIFFTDMHFGHTVIHIRVHQPSTISLNQFPRKKSIRGVWLGIHRRQRKKNIQDFTGEGLSFYFSKYKNRKRYFSIVVTGRIWADINLIQKPNLSFCLSPSFLWFSIHPIWFQCVMRY